MFSENDEDDEDEHTKEYEEMLEGNEGKKLPQSVENTPKISQKTRKRTPLLYVLIHSFHYTFFYLKGHKPAHELSQDNLSKLYVPSSSRQRRMKRDDDI